MTRIIGSMKILVDNVSDAGTLDYAMLTHEITKSGILVDDVISIQVVDSEFVVFFKKTIP